MIQIGGVPYGVGAPLLEGLETDPTIDFVRIPPTELIRDLRNGSLDVALVSSIEAFRQPGYRTVAGLSIASRGPARSVRVFKNAGPIRSVGLDSGSATTVTLLRVLMAAGRLGDVAEDVEFDTITPTVEPDNLPHDLVMLIGDCGLNATSNRPEILDLGACWFDWIWLPFVWALWLIRPGADPSDIIPKLHRARQAAVEAEVDDGTGGAIYYEFGAEELNGLCRFRDEAAALDLADGAIQPQLLGLDK